MWRPEQKSVLWMKDLIRRFTKRGDWVMDYCAVTCPTAKAFLLLGEHRKFVSCHSDSELIHAAEPDLLLTFLLRALNPKSDITVHKEVRAIAEAFK